MPKTVATLTHDDASRKNIPTAELQPVMDKEQQEPIRVAYQRRNRDLDPQLVWRGKDEQDESDLVVQAPPLYIQEKVQPKALIDDLLRRTREQQRSDPETPDLFADFNGLPDANARTEFYQHDANWSNRMILGDSLQVMASLAEREGLRGKVQCIYLDPPYGIKFNSNFQWSTTSRDVRDGKAEHITREPEQVKAFRDTWRDGIHSYLGYLRDRLTAARELLTDSGSIFVQISDKNVHRVRLLLDEVMGENNFVSLISYKTSSGLGNKYLETTGDYLLWYAKGIDKLKSHTIWQEKLSKTDRTYTSLMLKYNYQRSMTKDERDGNKSLPQDARIFRFDNLRSQSGGKRGQFAVEFERKTLKIVQGSWKTNQAGMNNLIKSSRVGVVGNTLRYIRYIDDFSYNRMTNMWEDTLTFGTIGGKNYIVQTSTKVIQRCILMTTDPGDLVLDPTCGSGTTAYVAEQWGRRWITIDTSRVALALARARIMGARYPYYLLADSPEGQAKEAEIAHSIAPTTPTHGDIRQGFVYRRVPHITLKSIANNAEIDVIWERHQETLEPLRSRLNQALGQEWEEWQIPRDADEGWPGQAEALHRQWWRQRIARQREIDASIAAKADQEYLYDSPYEDKGRVRVAGRFTVESLSPHRMLPMDENDELVDGVAEPKPTYGAETDFAEVMVEHLRTAGVQQAHREDKIDFSSLTGWPGAYICAEGRYTEGSEESGAERRAGIFIGPEFGTLSRPDLVSAAREAADAGFDALIACAFNYDAHSSEFDRLGRIPVLKARMNADLHMAGELKNTGAGNLFVIFGEPDIAIIDADNNQIQVKINGVDVFHPTTGAIRSDGADGIACWFIDSDYDEESFFVRHAYFLGAGDPYKSLKTTLKAEIDGEAWATLQSDTSRPFDRPPSGRIAVKVINHLGDEVMKIFKVGKA